ncbi:putative hydrolase [Actinobaculum suis]|uniref:Putative hydrolase n=1 Tax=Actinobaculum suis TaxID=1657 RepID=A0A1G7EG05_9ACTO|nr:zinc-dependent metalloprotease [Actinobaculum suis]MDY5153694.1 zinc-dependent metalloprotease [Actinobaculum suis]SDE62537.1 putative hydrolase [Actinobaculum suis]
MADANPNDEFEKMLRAVLGDEAAEQILDSMRNNPGGMPGGGAAMPDPQSFQIVTNQIRSMLGSAGDGPVNWHVGEQVARQTVIHNGSSTPSALQGESARSALDTASLWLDPVIEIGPVSGPAQVWSRLDFVAHCLPTFKKLTEPVGENIARAFREVMAEQLEHAPEEMRAIIESMLGGQETGSMTDQIVSSILGVQYGGGLAQLAEISFGTTDAGLPLVEGETCALVPENIEAFGEGLDIEASELELYIAVRETAAARLFSRVPWLRTRILDNVAAFASEISIDTQAIENSVREMDLDPQHMMEGQVPEIDLTDVFAFELNPEQEASLASLEHLISLVVGWIAAVTADAVAAHLPSARKLTEIFVRRDATEAPFNQAFGPLVGFELAPRRVREATAFWRRAKAERDITGRDALWNHPDLLPTPEDLDNPDAFFSEETDSSLEQELDAFLAELLEGADNDAAPGNADSTSGSNPAIPHEPSWGETVTGDANARATAAGAGTDAGAGADAGADAGANSAPGEATGSAADSAEDSSASSAEDTAGRSSAEGAAGSSAEGPATDTTAGSGPENTPPAS